MPSKLLYHVTATRSLKSILATGLTPRAGRWHGPGRQRMTDDDYREIKWTINRSLAAKKRKAKWDWDRNFVFPSQIWLGEKIMRQIAELGWSSTKIYFDRWPTHIFLTTSLRSAYEVANEFGLDDHKDGMPLSILAISRDVVRDLSPDRHLHIGKIIPKNKNGDVLAVPRRWSVMTKQPIPVSAIVSRYDLPKRRPRVLPRWLRPPKINIAIG